MVQPRVLSCFIYGKSKDSNIDGTFKVFISYFADNINLVAKAIMKMEYIEDLQEHEDSGLLTVGDIELESETIKQK